MLWWPPEKPSIRGSSRIQRNSLTLKYQEREKLAWKSEFKMYGYFYDKVNLVNACTYIDKPTAAKFIKSLITEWWCG